MAPYSCLNFESSCQIAPQGIHTSVHKEVYNHRRVGSHRVGIDSISRDEQDAPLTQYITNAGISRIRYTITHFKHHHRVLRLISNRFGILLSSSSSSNSSFFSRPSAVVSYFLTLVYT